MSFDNLSIREARDGVRIVALDAKDKKVNTLTRELGEELKAAFEELASDKSCVGVVLTSAKESGFIAGADIDMLSKIESAADGEQLIRDGHRMYNQLADLDIPVVAAIHGDCLGGGLETALACHGRVCTDADRTKLALPEVMLGLIPAGGGCQRLPRLVGVQAALDMILTGKNIRPRKALKMGLVDEVVPPAALEEAAVRRVLTLVKKRSRKDMGERVKGELDTLAKWTDSKEYTELLLGGNPLGRKVVFNKGREMVQKKTGGHYPAPFAAMIAVEVGLAEGLERGLEVEATEFGKLVVSDVSRRLVEIFFATQALKKENGVDNAKVQPREVKRLGVLGGGLMGSGIAYVSTNRGVEVRIKERDHDSAATTLGAVWDLVNERLKRRHIAKRDAQQLMARVAASPQLNGFRRVDMVIEAVFEDLELKRALLKEIEEITDERCVFASNTSSLPITQIAAAARRPENVLGMHFFSPVHKMPLLEIIVTDETSDETTVTAVAYGKRLGKTTIVVRDGVGFYTSRILAPYMVEATHLLVEGAAVEDIDQALNDFGFPVGPVTLMDEVGIDVGEKVARIMYDAFGERMRPPAAMEALVGDKRYGRKNKRGFYTYGGKKKEVDETVYDLIPGGRKRKPVNAEEVQRRVALQMVNEAAHCLGEGILRNPRDGDIGAIFGLGFPPFLGGPFRYIDTMGAENVVNEMKSLADRFGERFNPAPALVDAAKNKHSFRD